MKSIKWSAIVMALVYIGAGVYFFLYPETSEEMLCMILGFTLMGIGVLNVFNYFVRSNEDSFFRDDFKNGLILITIGSFALAYKPLFIELVYAIIGIIIMISGFGKLQDCVDTWRFGSRHGTLYIIMAFLCIAAGIVAAVNPFVDTLRLHYLIGGGLTFAGVSDLFSSIYLSTKLVKLRRDRKHEAEEAAAKLEETNAEIEKELEMNNAPVTLTMEEPVASQIVEEPLEEVEETKE